MQSGLNLQTMLLLVLFGLAASAQSSPKPSDNQLRSAADKRVALPQPRTQFRPKLSLQSGLKIAEAYIEKEHIDISFYWLYQAHYILLGDKNTADKDKPPVWHFWWVSENGGEGDDVEIIVYMDGRAFRAPSM